MTVNALAVAMALASGLIGCFAVMRRMSLAADPLSHVALPGIGIALALRIDPIFGAAALLFFWGAAGVGARATDPSRHRNDDRYRLCHRAGCRKHDNLG